MVGTPGGVGTPLQAPRPNLKTIDEGIALLKAFGGGDPDLRKLLVEMRAVQAANEAVLAQARQAVEDNRAAENAARIAEAAARKAKADGDTALAVARDKLQRDQAAHTSTVASHLVRVKEFEASCTVTSGELDARKTDLDRRASWVEAETQRLNGIRAETERLNAEARAAAAKVAAAAADVARIAAGVR
jgi:hypothetical protein